MSKKFICLPSHFLWGKDGEEGKNLKENTLVKLEKCFFFLIYKKEMGSLKVKEWTHFSEALRKVEKKFSNERMSHYGPKY